MSATMIKAGNAGRAIAASQGGRRSQQVSRPVHAQSTSRRTVAAKAAAVAVKEQWAASLHAPTERSHRADLPQLISQEQVESLEAELDQGASIAALRRFNDALRALPADRWEALLRPVFAELTFNLESFNPAFTSCILMVQRTIGRSDYVRRDLALKNLIQPLAGEYGMHNNQPQLKTHRELFADFFASLFHSPLEALLAEGTTPAAAQLLWQQMSRDIMTGGTRHTDSLEQASYALGYNLAIEYLADYEKTWMLDSFRALQERVLGPQGRTLDWLFLEVHAEGEAEHAAIGHSAVMNLVPQEHVPILRQAMKDHDRDFAAFYNRMADMLQQ
ncbi:hypothetical protein V8C86DRAFT_2510759 [Haematococcus lacustris]